MAVPPKNLKNEESLHALSPSGSIKIIRKREFFLAYQKIRSKLSALTRFWIENPALYVGLHMLLGCAFAGGVKTPLLSILCVLNISFFEKKDFKQLGKGLLFFSIAFAFTKYSSDSPKLIKAGEKGSAHFSISSISTYTSPFKQKSFLYKGAIKNFNGQSGVYKNIPCSIIVPINQTRPLANVDYQIKGSLIKKEKFYQFKPIKDNIWQEIPGSFSLAEKRYEFKSRVRNYLKRYVKEPKSLSFLSSLATGEIDERELLFEFSRLGLSHILAISGFHFGIVTLFFSLVLRLFLSPKTTAGFLLLITFSYFFFIGNAPSVQRAWIAITIGLVAQLFNLRCSSLNALGVGIIIAISLNPLVISHLGFQLTFLSSLAILLLYPLSEHLLTTLLPRRKLSEVLELNLLDKHGFILSSLIRKALALNNAVHIVAIPTLLVLFHKFPLFSIIYNLFFPIGVTISIILLLIASFFSFCLPPLGALLHHLNGSFTEGLLSLTSNPPSFFDFFIYSKGFSLDLLFLFYALLLLIGIFFKEQSKNKWSPLIG